MGNPGSDSLQQHVAASGTHWGSAAVHGGLEQRPAAGLSQAQFILEWLAGDSQPAQPAGPGPTGLAVQHYSFGLFSLGEAEDSWYFGSCPTGWHALPPLLVPAAQAAAAAARGAAAAAEAAAAGLGWAAWLLWQQGGPIGCLAALLEWAAATLAAMPAGEPSDFHKPPADMPASRGMPCAC